MYAFLVVITIILPGERNSFNMYSRAQYDPDTCKSVGNDLAARTAEYTKARMPYAVILTEASCTKLVTRGT
jgi:hypothetical protein